MEQMALNHFLINTAENETEEQLNQERSKWIGRLCISAFAGVITGMTGLAVDAVSIFAGGFHGVDRLGTALTIIAFPLFVLAAHCLDKIRDTEKAMRLEHYKRRGFIEKTK